MNSSFKPMDPTVLILILAVLVLLVIPLLWMLARRSRGAFLARLQRLDPGETIRLGPQRGSYRGGTGPYSKVKCDGWIALTDRRLLFGKMIGGPVEIDLAKVRSAEVSRWFRHAARLGRDHLVLHLTDGNDVAFYVTDNDTWQRHIGDALAARSP
jgi:hypothetical protein